MVRQVQSIAGRSRSQKRGRGNICIPWSCCGGGGGGPGGRRREEEVAAYIGAYGNVSLLASVLWDVFSN
ncbi:hypothetical protein N9L68_04205 [bacterium]|nr:hypothetical protein [bacterium]